MDISDMGDRASNQQTPGSSGRASPLNRHANATDIEDDAIELHAHYGILSDENEPSSMIHEVDASFVGLTVKEEAEVKEMILKAERELYNDLEKSYETPRSIKEELVDARNHTFNSTPEMTGLLLNKHGQDFYDSQSAKLNSDYREIGKEIKDNLQELKQNCKVSKEVNIYDTIKQKLKSDCKVLEAAVKIDRAAKLSEEDKAIMLDLVDIALGVKNISEASLIKASETSKNKRADIITSFVDTHFKTLEVNNLRHNSHEKDEKDSSNCQIKFSKTVTPKITDNIQLNTKDEKNISLYQVYAMTNPPPSTPVQLLIPDLKEEEETDCSIGLSSTEEEEVNELIKLAERVYKGKVDTTTDICKVEDESTHIDNITNDTMDTTEIDENRMKSIMKEVAVTNPTEINIEKNPIVAKKEKSDVDSDIEAVKTETYTTGRQSAKHFFISDSNNQESEVGVERISSKTNVDSDGYIENEGHEEDAFDNSDRGFMKLPMNDKYGRFFIDRSLFPVGEYQEGLSQKRWNPTAVLNELCTKLDWLPPEFGLVKYHPEKGFIVPVTVNGQEFMSTQWGYTKKTAKHLSSSHFLKYLGFKFTYHDAKYEALERFNKYRGDYEDLDKERLHPMRNTKAELNGRVANFSRHSVSRSRRSSEEYERARKPDSKKIRSDDVYLDLPSMLSTVNRRSKSSNRSASPNKRHSADLRDSLNIKNTLQSLNLKDILKLKDSAVIVINNFEKTQGTSRRRRRRDTSSSSPSPRDASSPEQKQEGDTPRTPPKVVRNPRRWENVDDIKPFVPRTLYQDNVGVPPRQPRYADRPHQPRPVASRPSHRCRCKLSFPHPSIHPWRTELGSSKYTYTNISRTPAAGFKIGGRTLCSYGDLGKYDS